MSFRQIFLLILVGITVLMVLSASGGNHIVISPSFISSTPSGTMEFFSRYPSSDRSGKASTPVDGLSEFRLINSGGDISVRGSEGDRIEIDHTITVFADTGEQAAEYLSHCHLSEEIRGNALEIRVVETSSRPSYIRGVFTNYKIAIPHGLSVDINNQAGDVSVEEYEGDVALVNRFRPTAVREVIGDLKVTAEHDSLTVQGLTGHADISARFGRVDLMDIDGDVVFDPEHCDSVLVEDVTGSVGITSRFSDLRVSNVGGSVNLDSRHSRITGSCIDGPVTVVSEFGDVHLSLVSDSANVRTRYAKIAGSEISGPIVVSSEYGDVDLSRVTNTVDAITRHGNVSIGLVKNPDTTGGYSIMAEVSSGKTTSDVRLDETEVVKGTIRATGLHGSGAIPVTVYTEYGDVRLRLVN